MNAAANQMWKERLAIPSYRIGEAAAYARLSPQTVAAWHKKRSESKKPTLGEKPAGQGLSFLQLIEVAVVAEMRRAGVKLNEIRRARDYLAKTTGKPYPFAQLRFKTDGADILRDIHSPLGEVAKDKLLAANHSGQYVWTEMLSERLKEFNYDGEGAVISWHVAGADKEVAIDPRLAFGAPQISGVRTGAIKSRWTSGEEVDEIAEDFALQPHQVVEGLLFEGMELSNSRISKWIN